MNNLIALISCLVALLLAAAPRAAAQDCPPDTADTAVRLDPVLEAGVARTSDGPLPAYIDRRANHIIFNGADWSGLRAALASVADSAVAVVHIGDSHLQADFATAVVRDRLQRAYGSNGRGLIIPFRLAGTNEPRDYVFSSPGGMVTSRLLKMPWPTDMPFTGVALCPVDRADFSFRLRAADPFDALTFFTTAPGLEVSSVTLPAGDPVPFTATPGAATLRLDLSGRADEVTVSLSAPRDLAIGGVSLSRGSAGLAYHVIGNNGATYSTYSLIGGVGRGIASLSPRLILISLGTNEAFGRTSSEAFRTAVHELVGEVRRANPSAALLLVTPAECHRRVTRRVRSGKRRRSRRVTSYAVNDNIARLRRVLLDYGAEHSIPVYDWYAVAGGAGSAARWLADKNLGRDRIHLTASGYQLQGRLLADALLNAFNSSSPK